jgi:hypothetical protein
MFTQVFFFFDTEPSFPAALRFVPTFPKHSKQSRMSFTADSHLSSSQRAPAHHFRPIKTVSKPFGPPLLMALIFGFSPRVDKGAGIHGPSFCRDDGCRLFHHRHHLSANIMRFGIAGTDWYLRDDSHFDNSSGLNLAVGRRC